MRATATTCVRALLSTIALTVGGLGLQIAGGVGLPAAGAATTSNACIFSYDNTYRDIAVDFTAAAPASAAPGSSVTISGGSMTLKFPDMLSELGYGAGLFKAGTNTFPVRVWLALAGSNTSQGKQTISFDTTASTTITTKDSGFVSATPLAFTVAFPDTSWTAGSGASISVAQAGGNSLSGLNDIRGSAQKPKGSLYVSAALGGENGSLNLDCQPGSEASGGTSFTPATAAAFATVPVTGPAVSPSATNSAGATASTAPAGTNTATTSGGESTTPGATEVTPAAQDSSSGTSTGFVIAVIVLVVFALGYAAWSLRRRRQRLGDG